MAKIFDFATIVWKKWINPFNYYDKSSVLARKVMSGEMQREEIAAVEKMYRSGNLSEEEIQEKMRLLKLYNEEKKL